MGVSAVLMISLGLAACSGVPKTSSPSGTSGGGPYTIGGTVSGLTGSGLVLQDNGGDNLTVTANGTFVFKTAVASGGAYAVTVATQPTNPAQSCTVTSGSGTATANVTSVAVACTTATTNAAIGGAVSGLAGTSLILQDNGGDSLTISANGPFTFKTHVTGAYAVSVLTQPTSPSQICTVANGSGVATADVTNVTVSCVLSYTIGGNVTGVVGTGLTLQNNGGDNLAITANGAFTFKTQLPTGTAYAVTVSAQPSNPPQTCAIATGTGSGTATANVTSIAINCAAVTFSVGGKVVGLAGSQPTPPNSINLPLTDNSFELQNNLGNTLIVTQNGPFTFATPEALNDQFEISIFHRPSSQLQDCSRWNYKGVVTTNISSIVVDCGHNDWTWIDGAKTAGVASPPAPQYGSFAATAPATLPNPLTNTPGARYGAAGWTDKFGNLFLFGGNGWELSGKSPADTLNAAMNDMWVCVMTGGDYCEWQLVGGYDPTAVGSGSTATTVGKQIIANAQQQGPPPALVPGARLGTATWTDQSGNFWLFGGSDGGNFQNDLWKYDTSAFNGANYTTAEGQWSFVGGSNLFDQPGHYFSGTLVPGARTNAVTWTDSSGNFWLFGGFGYDGATPTGFGNLNDLWEYTGGNWVFVSGGNTNKVNQNGIYGTQGVAASTNMPGGRQEAVGWADANGNLWLFGGEGEDSVGTGNTAGTGATSAILNDLWMYNIATNQWTWVAGSNIANQTGEYPAQPVTGPSSTITAAGTCGLSAGDPAHSCSPISTAGALPGSRWGASGWTDAGGNLWLFGGWGLDSTGTNGNGALNDLWVYTPNSTPSQMGTWAWIKGSNTGAQNGVYGDEIIPYKTYEIWTPGGRSNSTHWVDGNNQLWLFGGAGYDSTSTTGNGYLNDMWRYLPYP
jgi:Galactose oxidase, central domain/Kelch motif